MPIRGDHPFLRSRAFVRGIKALFPQGFQRLRQIAFSLSQEIQAAARGDPVDPGLKSTVPSVLLQAAPDFDHRLLTAV